MTAFLVDQLISRVRSYRKRKKIDLRQLEREAELSHRSLQSLDDEEWNPTAQTLRKLEAVMREKSA